MKCLITGGSGYIGRRLIDELLCAVPEIEILNVDVRSPADLAHRRLYEQCDIMDMAKLASVFRAFAPSHVVHLAANTHVAKGDTLESYVANTEGTESLLLAAKATPSVRRALITSTAFVCRPGYVAKGDEDFSPHTIYGQSKVITEQAVRRACLPFTWAIIRPGTIWGPGEWRQHTSMLALLEAGKYFHPGRERVFRPFGYIGNVAYQIRKLATEVADDKLHGRVFYICDPPTDLFAWANGCALRLTGRDVRVIPRCVLWCVACMGDLICRFKPGFPLGMFRYKSLTENYIVPIEPTLELVGPLPYNMDAAIDEFITWYRANYRVGHYKV